MNDERRPPDAAATIAGANVSSGRVSSGNPDSRTDQRPSDDSGNPPPCLVLRLPLEGPLQVQPVCSNLDDEVRLSLYVDRFLTKNPGVIHGAIAHWMLLVENLAA